MPIYEYLCKDCRSEFKTLRNAKELADVHCPSCGTRKVARLLSVTARTPADGTSDSMAAVPGCGACTPQGCGNGCMNNGFNNGVNGCF